MLDAAGAVPDWARAHGKPLLSAAIRSEASDFRVVEVLGFEPSGNGEHDFLHIEKTGLNTAWLARQLAQFAGIARRDVGYAGLKDRHAVTSQWFSVRRPDRDGTDWSSLDIDGVRMLQVSRNTKKLRRGTHVGNRFQIVMRGGGIDKRSADIEHRLETIRARGIPNYFGEQRFGLDGNNVQLAKAVFAGRRMKRDQRSIALSAARSFLFNEILDRRVRANSWDTLCIGDRANLDGSGSVFSVDALTAELERRCNDLDIHPTATLWGKGAPLSSNQVATVENELAQSHADLAHGLVQAGVEAASRALRVVPADLAMSPAPDAVTLSFYLPRGSYATAVLREIADVL